MRIHSLIPSISLFALLYGGVVAPAIADVAFEDFAYTPSSPLNGQGNNANGFSGQWKPSPFNATVFDGLTLSSGSLSYDARPTSGNAVSTVSQSTISGLVRDFSTPLGGINQTIFLSMLIRPESDFGSGTFGNYLGVTLESPTDPELFIGRGGANNTWSLEERGGARVAHSNVVPILNTTYQLVVKASFASSPNIDDIFALYVNPDIAQGETQRESAILNANLSSVTGIGLYYTGGFSVDEIRIGTTFASVTAVPEAGSFGMIAMGSIAAAGYIRLKNRRIASLVG